MSQLVIDDLTFDLRESPRRRTVGIAVERDSSLTLLAPPDTPAETLRGIVRRKRPWIYQKLAVKALLSPPVGPKEFLNGQGFYYLGRSYRLLLVEADGGAPALQLSRGRFRLRSDAQSVARAHFIAWYRVHLAPRVAEEIAGLAPRLEVRPTDVQVRDLGHRWGSCSPAGRVSLHWRVALLPQRMITYVVAHELAHLREPRHNVHFWTLLDRLIPDYAERKRWLAEHGSRYTL